MGRVTVTKESYIRHLPFSAVNKLESLLEPDKTWEKFVVNIPRKLEMADFEPKYDFTHVQVFAERGRKQRGSSTRSILEDWGTQNSKIKHLIDVLTKSQLYSAADYLSVTLLKGDPVPRLEEKTVNGGERREAVENTNVPENKDIIYERQKIPTEGHAEEVTLLQRVPHDKPTQGVGLDPGGYPDSVRSDHMSYMSGGCVSADLKAGVSVASAKGPVENDETDEEGSALQAMLSVEDIRLQHINFFMLQHITGNFNDKDLSAGGNLIGRGGFGKVYLGQFHNGFKVAVKFLKEENEDVMSQFETELQVLSKYRHENIVHLLGYSRDGASNCLIYQYMPNGSLEDRLCLKNDTPPLSAKVRINIARGTARGISYLNGQGLTHRDIKSANILLDSDFTPKVGDFATARMAPKGCGTTAHMTNTVIGTSAYLAPEAFQFDVSSKLDTFSFGVVLLELITGLPPYDSEREEKDLCSYVDENCEDIIDMVDEKAGTWDHSSIKALYDIAVRCLEHRKKKRPLVSDIFPELNKLCAD